MSNCCASAPAPTASGCGRSRRRRGSRSAAPGSTLTPIWPVTGRRSCSSAYLALIYAQMGYPEASREEARRIPAVSVRMVSEILSRLTSGQLEAERGDLKRAAARLPEVEDLLHRGVACGALADPWNILGFQGLFPLSPAREDSMADPRLNELVQVVEHDVQPVRPAERRGGGGRRRGVGAVADGRHGAAGGVVGPVRHGGGERRAPRPRRRGGGVGAAGGGGAGRLAEARRGGRRPGLLARATRSIPLAQGVRPGRGRPACARAISAPRWRCSPAGWARPSRSPLEDGAYSFHALALRWMLAMTQPADDADGTACRRPRSAAPWS